MDLKEQTLPGVEPTEGAYLPTTRENSSWVLPPRHQEEILLIIKPKLGICIFMKCSCIRQIISLKKNIKMDRGRKGSYQYLLIQSNLGHFSFHKKVPS